MIVDIFLCAALSSLSSPHTHTHIYPPFNSISFINRTQKFKIYIGLKCNLSILLSATKLLQTSNNHIELARRVILKLSQSCTHFIAIKIDAYAHTDSSICAIDTAANIPPQIPSKHSPPSPGHEQLILICIPKCVRQVFVSLQLFDCYICTYAWNSIGFDSARLYLRLPSYVW